MALRIEDVSRETGIPVDRVSKAEREMIVLTPGEAAAIEDYLRACLSAESLVLDENLEIKRGPTAKALVGVLVN